MLHHKIRRVIKRIITALIRNDENTVLLLHNDGDQGNTGHTVTINGTPILTDDKPIKYENRTDPNSAFGNSAYFNGTDAYLTIPDSDDWDICGSTSQDYTIDFWVKHDDHAGSEYYINQFEDGSNDIQLYHNNGSGMRFLVNSSGLEIIDTVFGGEITDTNWHHIALCKVTSSGPTVEYGLYKDGLQIGYDSVATTDTFTGSLYIGQYGGGGTYFFNGYMDELRIQKSNIFDAAPNSTPDDTITVPTSPHTSDANTVLLLHFSDLDQGETSAPTDSSTGGVGSPHTVTNVSSKVSGCSYWWDGAMKFDGSTDSVNTPDSADWNFGTGDFTVETWLNFTSASSYRYIAALDDTDQLIIAYDVTPANAFKIWLDSTLYTFAFTPTLGQFYHFALSRDGNNLRAFIDGTQIGSTADVTGKTTDGGTAGVRIGAGNPPSYYFDGSMAEFRISDTARYTTTFIPETKPFVSDANTALLLHMNGNEAIGSSELHDVTFANTGIIYAQEAEATAFATSLKFDGSTDYLTIPDSADWDICGSTSQDYTIDFWVKHTDHAGTERYITQHEGGGAPSTEWGLSHIDGTGLEFYLYVGAFEIQFYGAEITDTNWHHVALCKVTSGGATVEWGLYLDGTQTGYVNDTSTATVAGELRIGTNAAVSLSFDGYMDEIRIQKSNIFDAAPNSTPDDTITVPTAPYDTI